MSLALVVLLAPVGCASHTSHVRDPQGHPLPTTALVDADMQPAALHCGARRYAIVEPPPAYLMGTQMATRQVRIQDAVALCAKIRAHE